MNHPLSEQEIQVLPDFIANQIAAGEVVQRPESVVKELVENALDAGATTIAVVVRQSGKQLIHIVDNGKGMGKADLMLALKRHATSKIKTAEDLHKIVTLGFRGEALASIASVASIEIRSKRAQDDLGWKLMAKPNEEEVREPCQVDVGTQIFVRNLFYNVPARKKFLRSDLTEFRHIADTMTKFALAHPHIRCTFYDDDALIFDVHPSDLRGRIVALMGESNASRMISVEHSTPLVTVRGFVSLPQFASKARSDQYLFLNGRTIINRQINHAVMSAFEHLITHASYPAFIIFIEVDPTRVDINVHPQKHEVKFDDDRTVYSAVREAVVAALRQADIVPMATFRPFDPTQQRESLQLVSPTQSQDSNNSGETILVNRLTGEILSSPLAHGGLDSAIRNEQQRTVINSESDFTALRNTVTQSEVRKTMSAYEVLFGQEQSRQAAPSMSQILHPGESQQALSGAQTLFGEERGGLEQKIPFVYQLHRKYILLPVQKGLQVIDQHIAHERILYERALKAMNREYKYAQELLFPVEISITPDDAVVFSEIEDELAELGYHCQYDSAKHVLSMTSIPQDVSTGKAWQSLQELFEQYREYAEVRHTGLRDNVAASFACRASIKAGDYLSQEQMQTMVRDLYACAMPYVCPHGRPVMIDLRTEEFDRRFGRTVERDKE